MNKKVREILNRKIKEFQEESAYLMHDISYAPETIATLLEFCAILHIIMLKGDKALWTTACNIVFEKMNKRFGNGNNNDMYH